MIINSLEQMENIVKRNRQLSWDGWDVVKLQPRPGAWSSPSAAFVKGKWYQKSVYPVTELGWSIPDYIVR